MLIDSLAGADYVTTDQFRNHQINEMRLTVGPLICFDDTKSIQATIYVLLHSINTHRNRVCARENDISSGTLHTIDGVRTHVHSCDQ